MKSLILVNPYSHIDTVMVKSLNQAMEGIKGVENSLVLLDHLLHSSEMMPNMLGLTGMDASKQITDDSGNS